MIKYSLICSDEHGFEAWFSDSKACDEQIKKSNSSFILYSSPMMWLSNKKNMPNVDLFVKDNYYLYKDLLW